MAKLVSLPEIIQNIYVKLEESGQGGSGTGGNCSSNITIDASTNTGTLNISDGSVLSTQVLNVEDTPKAGRVTLTDKDSNSISFDAVTVQYLGKNYYTKSVVDEKLSEIGSSPTNVNVCNLKATYDFEEITSDPVDINEFRTFNFYNESGQISIIERKKQGQPVEYFTLSTNVRTTDDINLTTTAIPTKAYVDTEINSIKSQLQTISSQGYDDTQIQSEITSIKEQLQTISSQGYDDTELKNRVTVLENKVSNMVTYADIANLFSGYQVDVSENSDINQLLSTQMKGSPTTTLTVDDLNFIENNRQETTTEIIIHYTATTNTEITFKDGSHSNILINFTKTTKEKKDSEYVYVQLKNGVKIQRTNSNTPAYVDTGLTKNGNYSFEAYGYTTNGNISVLVGSYDSNTDRTTLRMLSSSNKLQSMWSANNEITSAEANIDFNSPTWYFQNANHININQTDDFGTPSFLKEFTNTNTNQTTNTPIYLFNETTSSNYDNGVLIYAGIATIGDDSESKNNYANKTYIKYFIPCKNNKTNEIVLIDVADYQSDNYIYMSSYIEDLKNGNIPEDKIYRPTNGILVEVK